MLLESVDTSRLGRMGMSVIPGITHLTPNFAGEGIGGLGETLVDNSGLDLSSAGIDSIAQAIQKGLLALNAQRVFEINLDRLQSGRPPIPTSLAAPTVNLGIAGISTPMLLGGAALLLFLLLRRR
jgi:hypothetical protein